MISHKSKHLAKYKDAADISEGIKFCLQNNIKGYLLPEIQPLATLQKHLELFEQIKGITTNCNIQAISYDTFALSLRLKK